MPQYNYVVNFSDLCLSCDCNLFDVLAASWVYSPYRIVLNDDILYQVFSYISLKDRIRAEMGK